jgi:hypothetical protein
LEFKASAMTNTNRPLPYADDVESIPEDEADDIPRVVQALELILTNCIRPQDESKNFSYSSTDTPRSRRIVTATEQWKMLS